MQHTHGVPPGDGPPSQPPAAWPPKYDSQVWPLPPAARYEPPPPVRRRGPGKIAALVIGLWLGIPAVLTILVYAMGPSMKAAFESAPPERDDAGRVQDAGVLDKDDLRVGDCLNDSELADVEVGTDTDTTRSRVDVVPCSQPHDFEVAASFPLVPSEFVDDTAVMAAVERACMKRIQREWSEDRRLLRDKILAFYVPRLETRLHDNVVCMMQPASGMQMTSSIR